MCLAIYKPAKVVLPESSIRNGWINNPGGGGYGFIDKKGKLITRKGFMKLVDFNEAYAKDSKQYKQSPFLVHFRIPSMGGKGEDMTHPFEVENGLLIHNGTLMGTGAEYGKGDSDTCRFAERYKGDALTEAFVKEHKRDLGEAIGTYNKIALLYATGNFHIINESAGTWHEDVWYSNHSFKDRPRTGGMYDHGD